MSEEPTEGPYLCPYCPAGSNDLTDQVIAEREEQMTVLRSTRRRGKWSVIVTCPNGHEVVVDGEWPTA